MLPNIYFRNKDLSRPYKDILLPAHWLEFQDDQLFFQGLGHRQFPLPTSLNNDAHTLNSSRIPGQIWIN